MLLRLCWETQQIFCRWHVDVPSWRSWTACATSVGSRLLKSPAAQEVCDLLCRVLGVNPLLQRELNVSEKISGDSQSGRVFGPGKPGEERGTRRGNKGGSEEQGEASGGSEEQGETGDGSEEHGEVSGGSEEQGWASGGSDGHGGRARGSQTTSTAEQKRRATSTAEQEGRVTSTAEQEGRAMSTAEQQRRATSTDA
ncbi:hypothetical protein QTP70_003810 [Hemibagrus guttatus]|uniref:Uncharacterized protein n=1 Tax=Hemibagrus guttatus TaxID=175788 RepID=A0AAE0PPK3_9TELE|nr:hypothetical protein QTP70_003810 [Hemibagrus guttatus]